MAINYGRQINSPSLARGQVGTGTYIGDAVPTPGHIGAPNIIKWLFGGAGKGLTWAANKISEAIKHANNDQETLFGYATSAITHIPGSIGTAIGDISSATKGTKKLGHDLLQIGGLGAYFIPGIGPAVAASLFASETTWNTIDLAKSGKGRWQDYAVMWGGVAAVGIHAGKPFVGKVFKNSQVTKLTVTDTLKRFHGATARQFGDTFTDLKSGFLSPQEGWAEIHENLSTGTQWADKFKKGVGRNPFKSPESRIASGFGKASTSKFLPETTKQQINELWQSAGGRAVTVAKKNQGAALTARTATQQKQIKDSVLGRLTAEELNAFEALLEKRSGGTILSVSLAKVKLFYRRLSASTKAALRADAKRILGRRTGGAGVLAEYGHIPRNTFRLIKSAGFYSREVQIFQNLNGSDAGRWIAESGYSFARHGAKTKLGKRFTKKWWKGKGTVESEAAWWQGLDKYLEDKGFGKTLSTLNNLDKLKDNYVASGGVLFPPNRYILGYKEISKVGAGPATSYELLVSFIPTATADKPPIVIRASLTDVEKLQTEGVRYWFRVGQSKGWFMTRGGRNKVKQGRSLGGFISTMLAVIPIQAIRTLGSLIHNVKDFTKNFADNGFVGGLTNYWEESTHAFKTTSINRVGRTFTAGVIGAKYGKWAGRFSQQIGTAAINAATVSKYTKTGKLKRAFQEGGSGRVGIFNKAIWGTGKSGWDSTVIGKRVSSDIRRSIHKTTGARYTPTTYKRKATIYGSVAGRGTKRSPGWFGSW